MPIDSKHPAYKANLDRWQRCRDAYNGEDAVKAAADKYLPKLSDQDRSEYEKYKTRALYYEAVGRTIDGFVGSIARKPPTIELPDGISGLLTDVTADGVGLPEFIKKLSAETLLLGRGGVLVDFSEDSQMQYLVLYQAENIINWSKDQIILQEAVTVPEDNDEFALKEITQIRRLHMEGGHYTVTLYRQKASAVGIQGEWQVFETHKPSKRTEGLKEIPFYWLSSLGRTARIEKPPLLGLVTRPSSMHGTVAKIAGSLLGEWCVLKMSIGIGDAGRLLIHGGLPTRENAASRGPDLCCVKRAPDSEPAR